MTINAISTDNLTHTPKLIVFDLDFTLWPSWCAVHISPPFKFVDGTHILDSTEKSMGFYPEVLQVLEFIKSELQIPYCSASRTPKPENGKRMLELLHIDKKPAHESFLHNIWGGGSKIAHFKEIQKLTGIDYRDMLFFDDEPRNQDVEHELGVQFHLVTEEEGVCIESFNAGLKAFNERGIEK